MGRINSTFGRLKAPFMLPDGWQASWSTLATPSGNVGLCTWFYKCLTGTALTKPSKRKVRPHAMKESMACMSELRYSAKLTSILSQVHSAKL